MNDGPAIQATCREEDLEGALPKRAQNSGKDEACLQEQPQALH